MAQYGLNRPQFSRNRLSSEFFGFLGTPSKKGKAGKTEGENEGFSVSLACLVGFSCLPSLFNIRGNTM